MDGNHRRSFLAHPAINGIESVLLDGAHNGAGGIHLERGGNAGHRHDDVRGRKGKLRRALRQNLVAARVKVIPLPIGDRAVDVQVQVAPHQQQADHGTRFKVRGARRRVLRAPGNHPALHGLQPHAAELRRKQVDGGIRKTPEAQGKQQAGKGSARAPGASGKGEGLWAASSFTITRPRSGDPPETLAMRKLSLGDQCAVEVGEEGTTDSISSMGVIPAIASLESGNERETAPTSLPST